MREPRASFTLCQLFLACFSFKTDHFKYCVSPAPICKHYFHVFYSGGSTVYDVTMNDTSTRDYVIMYVIMQQSKRQKRKSVGAT